MKKVLIIGLLVTFYIGCTQKMKKDAIHSQNGKLESLALRYFVDSLLYRSNIFKFEKKSWDSSELILPSPIFYDSTMYKNGGLFVKYTIYADSLVSKLTKPYIDSIELEFSNDEIKSEYELLNKTYNSLKENNNYLFIDLPKSIVPMDIESFEKVSYQNALFLEVMKGLPVDENSEIIQFRFTRYHGSMKERLELYIHINSNGVIEWFFN